MASNKPVYIDTKTGKIVEGKQPEEAVVVIAEGEDLTDEVRQARIDRATSDFAVRQGEYGEPAETADAKPTPPPRTVTTTTARTKK